MYRLEPTATSNLPSSSLFAVEDRCESIADSTNALTEIEAYSATAVSERVRGREKPFVLMMYRLEPTATSSRPSSFFFAVEDRCASSVATRWSTGSDCAYSTCALPIGTS
jgi:hypothetical protein